MEASDAEIILKWENDQANWEVSNTNEPFKLEDIIGFVSQVQDITLNKQIRLIICLNATKEPIGCIDLFEYEESKQMAGVGILIAEKNLRRNGYGAESLNVLAKYCSNELSIVHLFCNIAKDNSASIRLFEKCGFLYQKEDLLDGNTVNYYVKNA